jgi:hypothetical protein
MAAEPRAQWTIKSKRIDPELQNACRMAAERQGMAMGDWCVETLRAGAVAVLKGGEDEGTPASTPPARLEDVAAELTAKVGEMFGTLAEQQAAALAKFEREQAGKLARMRRGRWRR